MTIKEHCEQLSGSFGKPKDIVLAELMLEAIETMERAQLVIDLVKYPMLIAKMSNWLDKVNGTGGSNLEKLEGEK